MSFAFKIFQTFVLVFAGGLYAFYKISTTRNPDKTLFFGIVMYLDLLAIMRVWDYPFQFEDFAYLGFLFGVMVAAYHRYVYNIWVARRKYLIKHNMEKGVWQRKIKPEEYE